MAVPGLDDGGFNLQQLVRLPTETISAIAAALTAELCTRLLRAGPVQGTVASEPGLIDAPELAKRLSLPESWLRTRARSGRIPAVRAGRYYRFDERAVRAAIEAAP